MDSANSTPKRQPVVLGPAEGRTYAMGRVSAVFKADGPETESRYSISEWRPEPHTQGPGAHSHPEDDIFFVTLGTMSVLLGSEWTHVQQGSFVLVPGGTVHDFENRTDAPAAVLTCPCRARSSHICPRSSNGSLPIQLAMQAPNPSIERASSSELRLLPAAAHVER